MSMPADDLGRTLGAKVTTFSIGGPLYNLVEIDTIEELRRTVRNLRSEGAPYRILGGGSNLLVPDQGIDEVVIKLGRGFRVSSDIKSGQLIVSGAMPLMSLSRELSRDGWSGLEFAGGIPATLGGAVRMNAGAHGSEMASIIEEVRFVDGEGDVQSVLASALPFAYRDSGLPEEAIVYEVVLKLASSTTVDTIKERERCLEYRKKTQPLTQPSAGSVFTNPSVDNSAGKLIEEAGLKGHTIGGAKVSDMHGNWIVNEGRQASSEDVRALIELCRSKVKEEVGILLETEIVVW